MRSKILLWVLSAAVLSGCVALGLPAGRVWLIVCVVLSTIAYAIGFKARHVAVGRWGLSLCLFAALVLSLDVVFNISGDAVLAADFGDVLDFSVSSTCAAAITSGLCGKK